MGEKAPRESQESPWTTRMPDGTRVGRRAERDNPHPGSGLNASAAPLESERPGAPSQNSHHGNSAHHHESPGSEPT